MVERELEHERIVVEDASVGVVDERRQPPESEVGHVDAVLPVESDHGGMTEQREFGWREQSERTLGTLCDAGVVAVLGAGLDGPLGSPVAGGARARDRCLVLPDCSAVAHSERRHRVPTCDLGGEQVVGHDGRTAVLAGDPEVRVVVRHPQRRRVAVRAPTVDGHGVERRCLVVDTRTTRSPAPVGLYSPSASRTNTSVN